MLRKIFRLPLSTSDPHPLTPSPAFLLENPGKQGKGKINSEKRQKARTVIIPPLYQLSTSSTWTGGYLSGMHKKEISPVFYIYI